MKKMTNKFNKSLGKTKTFNEWLTFLGRFNFALIKENGLQMWTIADYRAYWLNTGRTI